MLPNYSGYPGKNPTGVNWYSSIWGSIIGWGQCTRHELGWRCEYAMIIAFMDPFGTALPIPNSDFDRRMQKYRSLLKSLSQRFDVPIVSQDNLEEFTVKTVLSMSEQ